MWSLQKMGNFSNPLNVVLTMKTMSFLVILFGLVAWPMFVIEAGKAPPPVRFNKCCRIGEILEQNKECSFGNIDQWWPVIFLLGKGDYFRPQGEAPKFFRVNESIRPSCQSPELISGAHKVALFSNGSLYLSDRLEVIESDNFCVDKDVALVCRQQAQNSNLINQPLNRTLVRKCCPEKAIYQTQADTTCVTLRDGHEIIRQKLIENSTNFEYRYGFPQCRDHISGNNIAIIGKFNETKFDESTGNLTLAEGIFQSEQYCLEHINDDNGNINVHVFTCTEYLPASGKSEKVF